jgi:CheY-like chemotaxis protein
MPATDPVDLQGLRILVVEDTLLVADLIAETLDGLGCSIVGPVARLAPGLRAAASETLDGALLDVNLAGERCFPIADALVARAVPFVFLTGYGDAGIPSAYRDAPRLTKPFRIDQLIGLVERCFVSGASPPCEADQN